MIFQSRKRISVLTESRSMSFIGISALKLAIFFFRIAAIPVNAASTSAPRSAQTAVRAGW